MKLSDTPVLNKDCTYLLCYTRTPLESVIYSAKLAYSMHLAASSDGDSFEALNHNSGVLFVKATANKDGTLNAKSLKNPYIFYMQDGTFGVIAERIEYGGENDFESKGCVMLFTSADLLHYKEVGLISLKKDAFVKDAVCDFNPQTHKYEICWCDEAGTYFKNTMTEITDLDSASMPEAAGTFSFKSAKTNIDGAVERNVIRVPGKIGNKVKTKMSVLKNIEIHLPETVTVSSAADLDNVKAVAVYNDGSTAVKRVDWDTDNVDWHTAGNYEITGTVHQDSYHFPAAINRADPCIAKWGGKYYFIATNDADNNHTLYMREADTIPGLVEAKEVLILDSDTYEHIKGLLWAPEFHEINGELYIFHAATTGEFFYEESHVMKLKSGGNPICAGDWSMPQRVVKKDGTYLCEAGKTISLDMTNFKLNGEYYVVWSQREFLPVDLGAWLYIAKVSPDEPWKLTTDPVLLSKPEYGWANNVTFVDEGAFALITKEKIFLTFASAAVDATYVVGLLSADLGADLMEPNNWTKVNYPILTSRSVEGEYGTGHSSFVIDDDETIWLAYHARFGVEAPRSSGIRRVQLDIDGYPVLDLTEELDLNRALKNVRTKLVIRNDK